MSCSLEKVILEGVLKSVQINKNIKSTRERNTVSAIRGAILVIRNVKEDVEHVIFNCKKNYNFRMKWKEVEAENDRLINYILEKHGMQRDKIKAFIMFLKDTGVMNEFIYLFE